jgi:TPR repeat protein
MDMLFENILAKPGYGCDMISTPGLTSFLNCTRVRETVMTNFRLFLVAALLVGFVTPAYAGYDEAKAAYDRREFAKAYAEFRPLAEQGDAGAQFNLGQMLYNGEGVSRDYKEAAKWYRKAADQEHTQAQFLLGFLYLGGQGVEEDKGEALKWFRKAADRGEAFAQMLLGEIYAHGDHGVKQDYAEAVNWYSKAADQGLAAAQCDLGVMYAKGQGVPQDLVRAHMWFNLALSRGLKGAEKNRDKVAKDMTPPQIAEAQRMAAEWKPKCSD